MECAERERVVDRRRGRRTPTSGCALRPTRRSPSRACRRSRTSRSGTRRRGAPRCGTPDLDAACRRSAATSAGPPHRRCPRAATVGSGSPAGRHDAFEQLGVRHQRPATSGSKPPRTSERRRLEISGSPEDVISTAGLDWISQRPSSRSAARTGTPVAAVHADGRTAPGGGAAAPQPRRTSRAAPPPPVAGRAPATATVACAGARCSPARHCRIPSNRRTTSSSFMPSPSPRPRQPAGPGPARRDHRARRPWRSPQA
jgi:hypothetical protein